MNKLTEADRIPAKDQIAAILSKKGVNAGFWEGEGVNAGFCVSFYLKGEFEKLNFQSQDVGMPVPFLLVF